MNEVELFNAARSIVDPGERAAYLDQACGADADLRQHIEGLLKVHEQAGSFLQQPVAQRPAAQPAANEQPPTCDDGTPKNGTVIGAYKLLQQIGEGGMGVVWMAEQTEPVKRKVALKVIKPGMDSRQVIARFEAERQALAMMDHVNIARVFDGGCIGSRESGVGSRKEETSTLGPDSLFPTPDSRPYFVMELVHGVPITKYCDDNHLTPRERLELFVPVCQAIQHAHQKGIIHRDIKPSNVMVTLYDGMPVPKVIDFGVAKATEQKLTERTLFTQYGAAVGTYGYMSPEQAEMSALGVDTRSDIYSLGVLLYELLTGSTPLTHERVKEAGHAEIVRMIKEEEPPKPSTRLSDSGEALASISANRHTEPAKLTKLVKGELDWIVMKCLEKDRNRRYETAKDFAADVQRYLNGETVLACPPSAGYRFRKFARRNKVMLTTASFVAAALVLGIAATTWQAVRAMHAEKVADEKKTAAETALANEEEERRRANKSEAEALELKKQAETGRKEALSKLVQLHHVPNGMRAIDLDDLSGGALWFAEALRLVKGELPEGSHRIRVGTALRQFPRLSQIWFHDKPLYYAAFSPDGRRAVTCTASPGKQQIVLDGVGEKAIHFKSVGVPPGPGEAQVWDLVTGQAIGPPLKHLAPVRFAAFSPDGQKLVTAFGVKLRGEEVAVWEIDAGKLVASLGKHETEVEQVLFSGDGKHVFTTSYTGTARIWDVASHQLVVAPVNEKQRIARAVVSRDGKYLAGINVDKKAQIWELATGKQLGSPLAEDQVEYVTFSPDSRQLLTAAGRQTARLWDVATGAPVTPSLGHGHQIVEASFSPDSRHVVTTCLDGMARVWASRTGQVVTKIGPIPSLSHVHFSPDGQRVLTHSRESGVRVWDAFSGVPCSPDLKHGTVWHVAFSPTGREIITASFDGTARVWDLATGEPSQLTPHHRDPDFWSTPPSVSPDGHLALTLWRNKTAQLWDLATAKQSGRPMTHGVGIQQAWFSRDGRRVVTTSGMINGPTRGGPGEAMVWDAVSGKPLSPPLTHSHWIHHAAFSADGRRVVTASQDRTASVWDVDTGAAVVNPLRHGKGVLHASFSPDGRQVVTTCEDGTAQVWDVASGAAVGPPLQHGGAVVLSAFSPDGSRVVTASADRTARIWEAATGTATSKPLKHQSKLNHAAFSDDDRRIVTASDDQTARVWDATTGEPVGPPLKHSGAVMHASFTPDNQLVVTASLDHSVRVWNALTGEAVTPPLRSGSEMHGGWTFGPTGIEFSADLRLPNGMHAAWFSSDGRRVFAASKDQLIQVWDIAPSARPVEDLTAWAQLLASRRLDATAGFEPLTRSELQTAWEFLRGKYPDDFRPSPKLALAWHLREAERAEVWGLWSTAVVHLDWLVAAEPAREDLRIRRFKAYSKLAQ